MNETSTNVKDIQDVSELYKEISNAPALSATRMIETMEIGKYVRQGDIYIIKVDEIAKGAVLQPGAIQLAIGTTQGSRHCLENTDVKVFKPTNFGSVLPKGRESGSVQGHFLTSNTRFTVTHPEHSNFSFPPGNYEVRYQLDPRTMSQVAD